MSVHGVRYRFSLEAAGWEFLGIFVYCCLGKTFRTLVVMSPVKPKKIESSSFKVESGEHFITRKCCLIFQSSFTLHHSAVQLGHRVESFGQIQGGDLSGFFQLGRFFTDAVESTSKLLQEMSGLVEIVLTQSRQNEMQQSRNIVGNLKFIGLQSTVNGEDTFFTSMNLAANSASSPAC